MDVDVITFIWSAYSDLTNNLPPALFAFLLRANLLLACPIAAAFIGFSQGIRSQRLQAVLMVFGALVAISLPLPEALMLPSLWRPWLTMVLILGLWCLPVPFSFLAHPRLGTQAKVLKYTRLVLAGLFLINIMFWG